VAAFTVLCSVITHYNANPRTPRGIEIVERVRAVVLPVAVEVGSMASPVYAQYLVRVVSTTPSTPWSSATTHVEVAEGGLLPHL
jgi:hypothetical protein